MTDIFSEALEKAHTREGILGSVSESKQDFLEKGKKAQVGEIREWRGVKFQKQPNGGWLPVKGEKKSEKKDEASDVELEEQVLAAIPNGDNGSYEYIDLEGILRAMPGTGKTPEDKVKKIEAILDKKAKKYTVASQTFYTLSDKVDEETIREDLIEEGLLEGHSEEDNNRNSEEVAKVKEWIGSEATDQEISDVVDAVEDFVSENMLDIGNPKNPMQESERIYDRADTIMDEYREHFDHWEGTDSMPDKKLKKILVAILYSRR